jgi:phosphoenolpyruvate synthase/pyruvate phosphate dikinase
MPIALMKEKMPSIYTELHDTVKMLERHMHDMQDTEFTVQDGRLFMLQTRNGKRTGPAALKIAIDLEAEVCSTSQQEEGQYMCTASQQEGQYMRTALECTSANAAQCFC